MRGVSVCASCLALQFAIYWFGSSLVLLYAKQENEEVFHPLHLVPPTLVGLALAVRHLT